MKFETSRLIIRPFQLSDDQDLYEMCSDPLTAYNAGWSPHPHIRATRNVILGYMYSDETFAIVFKENNKVIGTISLYKNHLRRELNVRELGFCINKTYRNLGIAYEAVSKMLSYGFEGLSLDLIMVCHHDKNIACRSVVAKFPFVYEGTLRMYRKLCDGTIVDAVMYSMKKEEYWRNKNHERIEA